MQINKLKPKSPKPSRIDSMRRCKRVPATCIAIWTRYWVMNQHLPGSWTRSISCPWTKELAKMNSLACFKIEVTPLRPQKSSLFLFHRHSRGLYSKTLGWHPFQITSSQKMLLAKKLKSLWLTNTTLQPRFKLPFRRSLKDGVKQSLAARTNISQPGVPKWILSTTSTPLADP